MSHAIYKTTIAILLMIFASSEAVNVTVEWDPALTTVDGDPLENIHGYEVFYGDTSGVYSNCVVVTNGTSVQLAELEYNKTHYFAVKTFTSDAESAFSEELVWAAPVMADEDLDGLSDDWETAHFGALNLADNSSDLDGNGICDLTEFLAGTDPNNPDEYPVLEIQLAAPGATVSFEAKQASGDGYENRSRSYTLMQCDDLAAGIWTNVSGLENIPAADQTVSCDVASAGRSVFYRTEIRLD